MSPHLFALLVASAAQSVPVLLASLAGARLLPGAAARHAVWRTALLVTLAMPLLLAAGPAVRVPVPSSLLREGRAAARRPAYRPGPDPLAGIGAPGTSASPAMATAPPPSRKMADLALLGWATVATLLLLRVAAGALAVERLRAGARPLHSPALERVRDDVSRRLGVRRPVPLLTSGRVSAPATIGWLRHAVLLPPWAAAWDPEEARAVLAHELAHVARWDCLTHALAQVTCALYWFNPLVWLAARRLRGDCEEACDGEVLRAGIHAHRYASLLLQTARRVRNATPAPALAMARPGQLERRIVALLDPAAPGRVGTPRGRRLAGAMALCAGVALAALRVEAAPAQGRAPARPSAMEPDLRGDSVASPSSERLPLPPLARRPASGGGGTRGPDSLLAHRLHAALEHTPTGEGDLVRDRAVWALSRMRGERLVEPLLDALHDPDWRVRAYAAWALGLGRERRAVPPLVEALGHPVWRLRAMAASALAEIGDPAARAAMAAALGDEAWQVRVSAVEYLGRFQDPATRALLRQMRGDRHIAVRLAADEALSGAH
jgi:beta-lactamase regulating signal transducer with metallopeptidase domain